ncbi:hypothetical protein [Halostella sp. PRR32]|uniref:hypothetical protein n=1 Tax=Halostella sp. PRR32 TaxID=3098147 RepID=UPI002B1E2181|nr:hypothetical protein [Halostella sp. PRR32]
MGAPDEFHDEAHEKAREITGERRYGEWGQCIATAKSHGGRCGGYAQGPHGKCNTHGGDEDSGAPEGNSNAEGNAGGGAPEDNTNAVTHGAYADHNSYYQDVLDDPLRVFVDDVFEDYLEQYCDLHGEPPLGIESELFRISVTHAKDIGLDRWADEKPEELESGHPLVDKETRQKSVGDEIVEERKYRESVVTQAQKKLSTDRRQWLKDLGLLEDPESQKADALGSLKDAWKTSAQGDGT